MDTETVVSLVLVVLVVIGAFVFLVIATGRRGRRNKKLQAMSDPERADLERKQAEYRADQKRRAQLQAAERSAFWAYGRTNSQMVCPHCQTRGKVRSKPIDKKAGISGGKATAALLTGGLSILATGLSRKEALTQAHCDNCDSTWAF